MLNKVVFLICIFFSLVSKANLSDTKGDFDTKCKDSFDHSNDSSVVKPEGPHAWLLFFQSNDATTPVKLKKTVLYFIDLNQVPSEKDQELQELLKTWKKVLLESLPILNTPQILELLNATTQLKNIGIFFEQNFFTSLIKEITFIVPKLNKQELIDIIYYFVSMKLTVTDSFVLAWRKRALELKKDFTSQDRIYMATFFRKLNIPPLRNPYDLNSGYAEEVPVEATHHIQP